LLDDTDDEPEFSDDDWRGRYYGDLSDRPRDLMHGAISL